MKRTGCRMVWLQTSVIGIFLLLSLLLLLGACSFHPRYQAFPISDLAGYFDYQIDGSTYVITYQFGADTSLDNNELTVAKEYALYRAGELAKSKGARFFSILHRDDWNLIRTSGVRVPAYTRVGVGLIIRLINDHPLSAQPHDDRIYEVDKLLKNLSERNTELATYEGKAVPETLPEQTFHNYPRWRSFVGANDSISVPQVTRFKVFGTDVKEFERGISITPLPLFGEFELAIWDERLISPFQLLTQCIQLADQEGYQVFKLLNWTVAEYRTQFFLRAWFRATARVVLQHQKEPDSLDPVFVVDEIRENVTNIPPQIRRMWRY